MLRTWAVSGNGSAVAHRLPALRGGLTGLVLLLLPLPWVTESGCGDLPTQTTFTGLDLGAKMEGELAVMLAVGLVLSVGLPLVIPRLTGVGARVVLGLAGLGGSLAAAFVGVLVPTFAVFHRRSLEPAGMLGVALFVSLPLDALVRLALELRAWWRGRPARPPDLPL